MTREARLGINSTVFSATEKYCYKSQQDDTNSNRVLFNINCNFCKEICLDGFFWCRIMMNVSRQQRKSWIKCDVTVLTADDYFY